MLFGFECLLTAHNNSNAPTAINTTPAIEEMPLLMGGLAKPSTLGGFGGGNLVAVIHAPPEHLQPRLTDDMALEAGVWQ